MNGVKFTVTVCPSSPLTDMRDSGGSITEHPQYYGISGATNGNGFVNGHFLQDPCCGGCCDSFATSGIGAEGGMLLTFTPTNVGSASDGASNTMIVGESSAPILTAAGGARTADVQGVHGMMMGNPYPWPLSAQPWTNFLERPFNLTTVRYPPNAPAIVNNPLWPGISDNYGPNKPLNSMHTGGIHGLMTDGRVIFISDSINMLTLRGLCTRDDGLMLGSNF
jgi:hypothetical protein